MSVESSPRNAVSHVEVPPKLSRRPFDERGYLIPWFVDYVDGKPDFRVMDAKKFGIAIREKRCWLCGDVLGVHKVFVSGPMCGINRTTSEPPCHRECALYAVQACPFLVKPHAQRRVSNLPDRAVDAAGHGLSRNPGVALLWTAASYDIWKAPGGSGYLLTMGMPTKVEFFAQGRPATLEEIRESVVSGLPSLRVAAELDGPGAVAQLEKYLETARKHFPVGVF